MHALMCLIVWPVCLTVCLMCRSDACRCLLCVFCASCAYVLCFVRSRFMSTAHASWATCAAGAGEWHFDSKCTHNVQQFGLKRRSLPISLSPLL